VLTHKCAGAEGGRSRTAKGAAGAEAGGDVAEVALQGDAVTSTWLMALVHDVD
jgi:hypothetical protein